MAGVALAAAAAVTSSILSASSRHTPSLPCALPCARPCLQAGVNAEKISREDYLNAPGAFDRSAGCRATRFARPTAGCRATRFARQPAPRAAGRRPLSPARLPTSARAPVPRAAPACPPASPASPPVRRGSLVCVQGRPLRSPWTPLALTATTASPTRARACRVSPYIHSFPVLHSRFMQLCRLPAVQGEGGSCGQGFDGGRQREHARSASGAIEVHVRQCTHANSIDRLVLMPAGKITVQ